MFWLQYYVVARVFPVVVYWLKSPPSSISVALCIPKKKLISCTKIWWNLEIVIAHHQSSTNMSFLKRHVSSKNISSTFWQKKNINIGYIWNKRLQKVRAKMPYMQFLIIKKLIHYCMFAPYMYFQKADLVTILTAINLFHC